MRSELGFFCISAEETVFFIAAAVSAVKLAIFLPTFLFFFAKIVFF